MPKPSGTGIYRLFGLTLIGGGTGYAIGNTLTISGGTFTTAATLIVTGIAVNGVITTISITNGGAYAVVPANPVAVTGGTGTGATFTAGWVANITNYTALREYGSFTLNATPPNNSLRPRELFVVANPSSPSIYVGNALGNPLKLVGTLGAQDASGVNITGGSITLNNFIPSTQFDVTTKTYVDSRVLGTNPVAPVAAATTVNITLSGLQVIDGYTTLVGDRILVKNQTDQTQNGIYIAGSGAWGRSGDTLTGVTVLVLGGSSNRGVTFVQTTPNVVIGTSNIVFVALSQASATPIDATTGLAYTNNILGFVPPGTTTTGQYQLLQAVPTGVGNATAWQSVRGVQAPTQNSDIATKLYVDSVASGLNPKANVRLASTVDLSGGVWVYNNAAAGVGATLTGPANVTLVLDGITPVLNDRILIKDQGNDAALSASVVGSGSGYAVNDLLTVVGGVIGGGTATSFFVASVNGTGGVTSVTINNPGNYDSPPVNPVSVTGGTGSGATFNLTFGNITFQNGIYTLTQLATVSVGAVLTRATDFDQWTEIPSALVNVLQGTVNAGTTWAAQAIAGGTVGTTGIVFAAFGGTAGNLVVSKGGTGVNNIPAGQIPFGNGLNPIGTSSALNWDSVNNRLGLNTATPLALLHVEGPTRFQQAMEKVTVDSTTALTGTYVVQTGIQGVTYLTSNATGNFSFNFVSMSTPAITLNSVLPVGHAITAVVMTSQGGTAFFCQNTLQVDGTSVGVTTRWAGPLAPTFGSINGFDIYVFTIIKTTAVPNYVILANRNQYGG